jgi:hypothetical protein
MNKTINLNGPGTLKFEFNLKTMVGINKIPQEKLIDYLTHGNYKLSELVMEFRSMYIPSEAGILGLLDMSTPRRAVEIIHNRPIFRLLDSFPVDHKVTIVAHDQVLIFYKQVSLDEHEAHFVAEFVYWDDKHPPIDGINIKTTANVSRLTRWQLIKYLDHDNYKLRNNPATIMNLSISEDIHRTDGRIVNVVEDGDNPLTIQLVCPGFTADRTVASPHNDDVLIIYDKDGKFPKYIYWED